MPVEDVLWSSEKNLRQFDEPIPASHLEGDIDVGSLTPAPAADDAGVQARRLAGDRPLFDDDDLDAALGERQRGRNSDDPRPDDQLLLQGQVAIHRFSAYPLVLEPAPRAGRGRARVTFDRLHC